MIYVDRLCGANGDRYSSSVQTLIVVGVIAVVLLLVYTVVQYSSRPPRDVSYWDRMDSADLEFDDGARVAD